MIARLQELMWTVVSSNPLLERLVVASIDLVVVTALVAAIVFLARIRSRRVIALLWLVALIKPVVSLTVGTPVPLIPIHTRAAATPAALEAPVHAYRVVTSDTDGATVRAFESRAVIPAVPPATARHDSAVAGTWAARAWIAGVMLMLGASIVDRLRLRRLIAASRPAGDSVMARYDAVAAGVRGGRPRLRVTTSLESPALAGTLRPVILIPAWIADDEHGERLEWALRHELAHWQARDPIGNLAAEVARALFFFHPLVWWVSHRWKEAMEMACDESVVTNRREARSYAEGLYQILTHVDRHRGPALSASLFATRTQIGRRIETLLGAPRHAARPGVLALGLVCTFAAAAFAVGPRVSSHPPKAPTASAQAPVAPESPASVAPVMAGTAAAPGVTVSYDNVNSYFTDDDHVMRLRAEGIEFEQDTGRIVSLREDGYLRVWESGSDGDRRVCVSRGEDGGLLYDYTVDGARADWNDDTRRWLSDILRQNLTRVRNHSDLMMAPPVPGVPAVAVAPGAAPVPSVEPAPSAPPAPPRAESAPPPPPKKRANK